MARKISRSAEGVLADARYVHSQASRLQSKIDAASAHLKTKPLPRAFFKQFAGAIRVASTGMTEQSVSKTQKGMASSTEAKLRVTLYDALTSVRDDVALVSDDVDVQRAFGRGRKFSAKSTPSLVSAAADFELAAKKKEFTKVAKAAGVTASRIAKISAARRSLTAADLAQNQKFNTQTSLTSSKATQLNAVRAMTVRVRSVVTRLFKKDPATRKLFEAPLASVAPRRAKAASAGAAPRPTKAAREAAKAEAKAAKSAQAAAKAEAKAAKAAAKTTKPGTSATSTQTAATTTNGAGTTTNPTETT